MLDVALSQIFIPNCELRPPLMKSEKWYSILFRSYGLHYAFYVHEPAHDSLIRQARIALHLFFSLSSNRPLVVALVVMMATQFSSTQFRDREFAGTDGRTSANGKMALYRSYCGTKEWLDTARSALL